MYSAFKVFIPLDLFVFIMAFLWQQLLFLGYSKIKAVCTIFKHLQYICRFHNIHFQVFPHIFKSLLSQIVTRPLGDIQRRLVKQLQYRFGLVFLGYCPAERCICLPVSVGMQTIPGFPLGFCLDLALFRYSFHPQKTP
jgi:hypothetical protein